MEKKRMGYVLLRLVFSRCPDENTYFLGGKTRSENGENPSSQVPPAAAGTLARIQRHRPRSDVKACYATVNQGKTAP